MVRMARGVVVASGWVGVGSLVIAPPPPASARAPASRRSRGATKTITFETPVPDNLIYPFTSNDPDDSAVVGLNSGQWSLM
jgi:hypothetical protein